ncbi:MAG: hypothetical protein AAF919_19300 [Pseudomonadota bacterium]
MRAYLDGIFRRHLDITIASGSEFSARILDRPGLWMSPDELRALSDDLITIGAKTLPEGSLTYGIFSGEQEVFRRTAITLVRRRSDGRPIAFNALALIDLDLGDGPIEVLHLGLVMVDPDQQSRGLSWLLYGLTVILLFVRNQMRPIWISNVTQVPAIVGMVAQTFSGVYPVPDPAARRSLRHLLLARTIMRDHRHVFGVGPEAGFDEDRFVITNAYTGGSDDLKKTYETAPKHRQEDFNRFCADQLDYARGDDVLQIGRMDFAAAARYLRGSVPRRSLAGLSLTLGILLVQRAVLPVIHWFDASRPWQSLRPWGGPG